MEKNRNSIIGENSILDMNSSILYKSPVIQNVTGDVNVTYEDELKLSNLKNLTSNPPRNKQFIKRSSDSQNISDIISTENVAVIVNGMGGLGKTELAKDYYWEENDRGKFDRFAWVQYNDNLENSFLSCFNYDLDSIDKDIDGKKFRKLIAELNSLTGNTLLIIDNFKSHIDRDVFKEECNVLSSFNSNIKVILTSREVITGFKEYKLGFLDETKSKQLFYSYFVGDKDDTSLTEILKLIGYHTLTIELLSKTASECDYSISELLSVVKELGFNITEVMEEEVEYDRFHDYIFNHLSRLFSFVELDEDEKNVLKNFAVLPSIPIGKSDLKKWIGLSNNSAINSLLRKGWINKDQESNVIYIRCHQLICEIALNELTPTLEDVENLVVEVGNLLVVENTESRLEKAKYLEIGSSILSNITDRTPLIGSLMNNLALTYTAVGDYSKSLDYHHEAVQIIHDYFGDENYDSGIVFNNLAMCCNEISEFKEALEYALRAKDLLEKYGDKTELVRVYGALSVIYQNIGDYDNSLKYGLTDKVIREELFGQNSLEVATCYNNLSMLYVSKGNHREALEYALTSKDIREQQLGNSHPSLATIYNNLFILYRSVGEFYIAYDYYMKTDNLIRKLLNEEHPRFVGHYSNLCALYIDLNRIPEALQVGHKAEKLLESNQNVPLELEAFLYTSLSSAYMKKKEFLSAKKYALKDVELCKQLYRLDHILLSVSYNNLSMIYRELKELNEALKYGLMALEIRENYFKIPHEKLATSYNNLMLIYSELGDKSKGIKFGLKSQTMFRKIFGERSREYATASINMGNLYYEKGSMEKAVELFKKAERIVLKLEPKSAELLYAIYIALYVIYHQKSNSKKSQKYLKLSQQYKI